jgi:hypothetical protein
VQDALDMMLLKVLSSNFLRNGFIGVLYEAPVRGSVSRQVVGIIVHKTQEALQSCTAVVRTLAVITVRQQHHKSGLLPPSLVPRTQKLVNYDLQHAGT